MLVSCLDYLSTLNMETIYHSETSYFLQALCILCHANFAFQIYHSIFLCYGQSCCLETGFMVPLRWKVSSCKQTFHFLKKFEIL
jgi:hypothetical protein